MKPGGGRVKGFAFEREIANKLKELGYPTKRGLGQARHAELPDVVGCEPYWIECKRMKKCDIQAALAQASGDSSKQGGPYSVPVAVTKNDGGPIIVSMHWDDWVNLIRKGQQWKVTWTSPGGRVPVTTLVWFDSNPGVLMEDDSHLGSTQRYTDKDGKLSDWDKGFVAAAEKQLPQAVLAQIKMILGE
jgi:hypothetical protein